MTGLLLGCATSEGITGDKAKGLSMIRPGDTLGDKYGRGPTAGEARRGIAVPVPGSWMLYASGSPGRPKGAHRAQPPATTPANLFGSVRGESVNLVTGPPCHAAPLAFSLAGPLNAGVGVVLMDGWSPAETLRLVAEHRITHSHMVPTMFHRLLALPDEVKAAADVSSLRMVIHGAAPCPPNADCAPPDVAVLRDGAIYDPAADAWTSIADAPIPLAGQVVADVMGDVAYFLVAPGEAGGSSTLLSYDASADKWDELPPPPVPGDLVATGDELVVFVPSHESYSADHIVPADPLPPDVVFDLSSATWAELPADPHRPSFDRKVVATDAGLVLLARARVPDPGVDPPIVRAAVLNAPGDLAAGHWSTLPDGEILWTDGFSWTGGLLVNPDQSSADGGETNNWGRSYPAGGILDPKTGRWSDLPDLPADADRPPPDLPIELYLSGSRTTVYGWRALDVPDRRWLAVPQHAMDDDGEPVDLPRTGHATAWVETPSGGAVLLWGGARWSGWDDRGGALSGELTSDGFLWVVPVG